MHPYNAKIANVTLPLPIATLIVFVVGVVVLLPSPCWCKRESQVVINIKSILRKEKQLDVPPYLTLSPRGLRWCAAECKKRPKCLSFNFVLASLSCELMDKSSANANLVRKTGSSFADISKWPPVTDMIGSCENFPCSLPGKCETDSDGDPFCFGSECVEEDLPRVNHGQPEKLSTETGFNLNFTCDPGYGLKGNGYITCRSDASWSPPNFKCKLCNEPPAVARAHVLNGTRQVGEVRTYECDSGYAMIGPNTIRCLYDGAVWEPTTFSCRDCGAPPRPGYARLSNGPRLIGTRRTYSCYQGYLMVGSNSITCQTNAQWTAPRFTCKNCGNPDTVSRATLLSGSNNIGKTRSYRCQDGYVMEGTGNITCQANAQWTSVGFTCKGCGLPPTVQWATVGSGTTTAGSVREYTCNSPKVMQGNNRIECQSSETWTLVAFSCLPGCGLPPTVQWATVSNGTTTVGSVREYACDSSKVMEGNSSIECQSSETWTAVDFSCVDGCGLPPTVQWATVGSGSITVGSIRAYTCDSPKVMEGNNSIECESSLTWTPVTFSCVDEI